jgi:hypothetical protein
MYVVQAVQHRSWIIWIFEDGETDANMKLRGQTTVVVASWQLGIQVVLILFFRVS